MSDLVDLIVEPHQNYLTDEVITNRDSIDTKILLEELRAIKVAKAPPKSLKFFDYKIMKRHQDYILEDLEGISQDVDQIARFVKKPPPLRSEIEADEKSPMRRGITDIGRKSVQMRKSSFSTTHIQDIDSFHYKKLEDKIHTKMVKQKTRMPDNLLVEDEMDKILNVSEYGKLTSMNQEMMDEEQSIQQEFLNFVNLNFEKLILKPFNRKGKFNGGLAAIPEIQINFNAVERNLDRETSISLREKQTLVIPKPQKATTASVRSIGFSRKPSISSQSGNQFRIKTSVTPAFQGQTQRSVTDLSSMPSGKNPLAVFEPQGTS